MMDLPAVITGKLGHLSRHAVGWVVRMARPRFHQAIQVVNFSGPTIVEAMSFLPLYLGLAGFLLTTRFWITFMNRLSPVQGLLVTYTIIFLLLMILETTGVVVAGIPLETTGNAIGVLLIIFSFFLVINLESCYVNQVVHGHCDPDKTSTVYFHSEDGAVYYLWSYLTNDPTYLRLLTYVVTPVVLSYVGVRLVTDKVTLGF